MYRGWHKPIKHTPKSHPKATSPDNYQYMFTFINILYESHSMIDNPRIDIIGVCTDNDRKPYFINHRDFIIYRSDQKHD